MLGSLLPSLTALAGLAVALVGCPGALENPERFTGEAECAADIEAALFAPRCGGRSCHGAGAEPAAGLDLVSPDVAARLIGHPSTGCAGRVLVSTVAPDQSLLLEKVGPAPTCGLRMPLGGELSAAELDCVRGWVLELVGTSSAARRS